VASTRHQHTTPATTSNNQPTPVSQHNHHTPAAPQYTRGSKIATAKVLASNTTGNDVHKEWVPRHHTERKFPEFCRDILARGNLGLKEGMEAEQKSKKTKTIFGRGMC